MGVSIQSGRRYNMWLRVLCIASLSAAAFGATVQLRKAPLPNSRLIPFSVGAHADVELMETKLNTPSSAETSSEDLPASSRLLPVPIINNSIAGSDKAHKPKSGSLLKTFPHFPLPWGYMVPPIKGATPLDTEKMIPLYVQTSDDGQTLGYYAVNPFTLLSNFEWALPALPALGK